MASELRVNTLKDAAGANSVAMTYVAGGSAKAWVFSTNKTTYVPTGSFNISSVTDNGAGRPEANFTSSFSDTNIVGSGDGGFNRTVGNYNVDGGITTSSFAHVLVTDSASIADIANDGVGFGASYHGDLA